MFNNLLFSMNLVRFEQLAASHCRSLVAIYLRKHKEDSMHKMVITVCSILLLISGCDKKSDSIVGSQPLRNEIFPLVIGNLWVFNYSRFDSTGVLLSSEINSFGVEKDTLVNGSRWFMLFGPIYLYANRDSGLCGLGSSGIQLLYKYPASVSDSYYVAYSEYVHIKSTDTSITTSLGKFSCYAYEHIYPPQFNMKGGSRSVEYLSPGIGQIKIESYTSSATNDNQYLASTSELTAVTLR